MELFISKEPIRLSYDEVSKGAERNTTDPQRHLIEKRTSAQREMLTRTTAMSLQHCSNSKFACCIIPRLHCITEGYIYSHDQTITAVRMFDLHSVELLLNR